MFAAVALTVAVVEIGAYPFDFCFLVVGRSAKQT